MGPKACIVGGALVASVALVQPAVPQSTTEPTGPVFQPAVGAIVSGLSGLVAGTQQALVGDRTASRIMVFRLQLTNWMLSAPPDTTKISLGKLNSDNTEYIISNRGVLCSARGQHAVAAADAAYLNAVTGSLDKFATLPKISTIGDALGSVFQNYSVGAIGGKTKSETAASFIQHCQSDIQNWPASVYGKNINKSDAVAFALPALIALGADLSAISTLYQAIVAIITPIVVTPAQALDAQRRADAISNFLKEYRTTLLKSANNLATNGTALAKASRLAALGQFAEKMSELRGVTLDLSKIDQCKAAIQNPVLRTESVADQSGKNITYYIPTDSFVVCYEQAWSQMLPAVQAAVTAAAQYDVLSDSSSDQLAAAVQTIENNLDKLDQPENVDVKDLWTAAAQLVAYGQTVSQALSPDNITKVKAAVDSVIKLFGGK
jgi:hypothetical protein